MALSKNNMTPPTRKKPPIGPQAEHISHGVWGEYHSDHFAEQQRTYHPSRKQPRFLCTLAMASNKEYRCPPRFQEARELDNSQPRAMETYFGSLLTTWQTLSIGAEVLDRRDEMVGPDYLVVVVEPQGCRLWFWRKFERAEARDKPKFPLSTSQLKITISSRWKPSAGVVPADCR